MDIARIERRLKKISTVVDAFKEDNQISYIEKDLLLSYIRELYDIVREGSEGTIEAKSHPKPKEEKTTFVQEVKEELHIAATNEFLGMQAPPINENAESKHEGISQIVHKVEEKTPPLVHIQKAVENTITNSDMASLFIDEEATELSERLSMSPISDIGRAIGINERIFTINELFDNNSDLFNQTIDLLNKAANFEEAKSILVNGVASQQGWDKEEKRKKAYQFIRTVRRRYL